MEDLLVDSRLYKIKDERFSTDKISDYQLIIKVQRKTLAVAVFDTIENRCLFYEKYTFDRFKSESSVVIFLQNIWTLHHFLNASFWKGVSIINADTNYTTVPVQLVDAEGKPAYLNLNCGVDSESFNFHSQKLKGTGAMVAFSAHKEIEKWFQDTYYPNVDISFQHQSACFINGILNKFNPNYADLFIYLNDDLLTIANFKKEQLQVLNSYYVNSANDILYFTGLISQELNLSQTETTIHCWGTFEEDKPAIKLLRKYFKMVNFGGRPSHINLGYVFDELPYSAEFDLFSSFE